MELILKSTEVLFPQAIENIEALKNELAPKMDYYASLVVTKDSIKMAKDDKAKLNKLKTAIENQRKEAKKTALALYEPLEKQCKELVALIDAPISAIDAQIKAFDDADKAEKLKALSEYFELINEHGFINIDDVLNPKWANKSVSLEMLKKELAEAYFTICKEYDEVKELYAESPLLTAILNKFRDTKSKSQTLVYATTIERQYLQEQAELQKQCESAQNNAESAPSVQVETIPEETQTAVKSEAEQSQGEPTGTVTFKVTCTRSQLITLRDYMKSTGINFEVVR